MLIKELINDYYKEPADEDILGFFLAIISHNSSVRTQKIPPFQRKKKRSNLEINQTLVKWPTKRTKGQQQSYCN